MRIESEKLKKTFGAVYRPFMSCAVTVLIVLSVFNLSQRWVAVAELKKATVSNRRMLNSRAQVQIILVHATLENRPLTPEEIDRIKTLWAKAEYDQIEDVSEEDDDDRGGAAK